MKLFKGNIIHLFTKHLPNVLLQKHVISANGIFFSILFLKITTCILFNIIVTDVLLNVIISVSFNIILIHVMYKCNFYSFLLTNIGIYFFNVLFIVNSSLTLSKSF